MALLQFGLTCTQPLGEAGIDSLYFFNGAHVTPVHQQAEEDEGDTVGVGPQEPTFNTDDIVVHHPVGRAKKNADRDPHHYQAALPR